MAIFGLSRLRPEGHNPVRPQRPVLETDTLTHRSVLCVGVGSGGSTAADLPARAGVGVFVLWDHGGT